MDLNNEACPKCGTEKIYSTDHDAYYCKPCNEWLEDICNDRECFFCNNRPAIPLKEQNEKP